MHNDRKTVGTHCLPSKWCCEHYRVVFKLKIQSRMRNHSEITKRSRKHTYEFTRASRVFKAPKAQRKSYYMNKDIYTLTWILTTLRCCSLSARCSTPALTLTSTWLARSSLSAASSRRCSSCLKCCWNSSSIRWPLSRCKRTWKWQGPDKKRC